ncbi:hypothetical protein GCM10017784_13340 [Deinococcus indicus]|uniref:GEVED domain-containing protein n=1 Tax=Deinococcus indicus TaxID=223556 RepID=UPI00174D4256|nr:GEVED domain-containing protein [Deinococcus indicus]GHG22939.1 hypothetical protein GCM10017784_13340 [Deinococcus indicus]
MTTKTPHHPHRPIWRALLTAAALTAAALTAPGPAGAYQIVGDLSPTATTWSGTAGTFQTTASNYAGGTASATFRSGLGTTFTAARDTAANQNSLYVNDGGGAIKTAMNARAGTYVGYSPSFTTSDVEGVALLTRDTRQNGSFTTYSVTNPNDTTQVQFIRFYADTTCYPTSSALDSAATCSRGKLTVTFTRPVTNPVLHLSGLGGNSAIGSPAVDAWGIATNFRLTNAGGSMTLLGTPANLAITTVAGQPQLGAAAFRSGSDYIQGTCTPATGLAAGCGSVQVSGTYTQLNFDVSMTIVRVLTGTPGRVYPIAGYDTNLAAGSTRNASIGADATNFALSVSEDFGDAPASYDPVAAASHVLGDLKLGATIDAENPGTLNGGTAVTPSPSAVTAGADNTGTNGDGADEDAVTTFPAIHASTTAYALTVPISGASAAGQVCGWIDFDRGGTFGNVASERACAAFASGATSVTLNWSGLSGLSAGTNYVRLRASYDATGVQSPTGRLDSGEVEDYRLTITPAADLSVTKTDGVTSVNANTPTSYTIRVTNNGPSSVTGAVLRDPAVSGLTVLNLTCSGTPGQCTSGTTPTTAQLQAGYALPTLNSGQFYELTLTTNVTATGSVSNVATITAPAGTVDPTPGNDSATDTNTVNPTPTDPFPASLCRPNPGTNAYADIFARWDHNGSGGTSPAGAIEPAANNPAGAVGASAANEAVTGVTAAINSYDLNLRRSTLDAGVNTGKYLQYAFTTTSSFGGQHVELYGLGAMVYSSPGNVQATGTYRVRLEIATNAAFTSPTVFRAAISFDNGLASTADAAAYSNQGAYAQTFLHWNADTLIALQPATTYYVRVYPYAPGATGYDNGTPYPGDVVLFDDFMLKAKGCNVPPTALDVTTAVLTGTGTASIAPLSASDLAGGTIQSFTVSTLPLATQGTLLFADGLTPVTAGATLTPAQASALTFRPTPGFSGNATFTFTATDNNGATDTTPATYTVPVSFITDLSVTKTAPAFAVPGETLTFGITVTNTTAVPAAAYTVTDTLPAGLTFASASQGGTYDSASRTVTWTLPALAGNATQTLTLTAAAPGEAQVTGGLTRVQNTASVALPGETALGNNTSAPTDTRLILTSVRKEVRNVSAGTAFGTSGGGKPGEILEYCLITRNLGGADLGAPTGYVVRDAVPGNVTARLDAYDPDEPGTGTGFGVKLTRGSATTYLPSASATLTGGGGTFGSGALSVNLGVLTAGETVTTCFQTTIR